MGNVEQPPERRTVGRVDSGCRPGHGELDVELEFSARGSERLEDVTRAVRRPAVAR